MSKRLNNQRGTALLETAITIPIVLLICVGIFEFGRAYQTFQILTNAAREGARTSIIMSNSDQQVTDAVRNYLTTGRLLNPGTAVINVERGVPMGASNTASRVTVSYPFNFIVLNPVAKLVVKTSTTGTALTMQSVAFMRNEI